MRLKLMQYQDFGDALGVAPAPVEFGLVASAAERSRVAALLEGAPRPLLAVILGSSWPSRIYFPDSIAAVIREMAIARDGSPALFPVLIGSGRDEAALADQVAAELAGAPPSLNLAGRTNLRDLVAIFAECAAAFGPDSGPMHIAAAAGCPVVSLWGATAPERSAPWGYADLALHSAIPCHPCYLRECPIGRECMRRIAPGDVAAALSARLRGRARSSSSLMAVQGRCRRLPKRRGRFRSHGCARNVNDVGSSGADRARRMVVAAGARHW